MIYIPDDATAEEIREIAAEQRAERRMEMLRRTPPTIGKLSRTGRTMTGAEALALIFRIGRDAA